MIRIEVDNLPTIVHKHYDGVVLWVDDCIQFYNNFFDILEGKKAINNYNKNIIRYSGNSTLNSHIKEFIEDSWKNSGGGVDVITILNNAHLSLKPFYISNTPEIRKLLRMIRFKKYFILTEQPDKLRELYIKLVKRFPSLIVNLATIPHDDFRYEFKKEIKGIFENIFCYNKLSNKSGQATGFETTDGKEWEAYDFTEELGVKVCPYCNRTEIDTIYGTDEMGNIKKILRAQLDHFFCESKYPIFAISFYNLIPCCSNCNTVFKGDTVFFIDEYLHPYLYGFNDDAKFNYIVYNISAFNGHLEELKVYFDIDNQSALANKIKNNISVFCLDSIYMSERVQEIVCNLIKNKREYHKRKIEAMSIALEGLVTKEQIIKKIFGDAGVMVDKKDIINHEYGKLKYDIYRKLKVI